MRPVKYLLLLVVLLSVAALFGHPFHLDPWLSNISALLSATCAVIIYLLITRREPGDPIPHVPPITVMDSSIRLEMLSQDGSKARYLKHQVCRANMDNITSYVETGLFADGEIGPVTTDEGTEIATTLFVSSNGVKGLPRRPGRVLEIRYKEPYSRGDVFPRMLAFDYLRSFERSTEYFTASIGHACLHFTLTVVAHPERPFKRVWLEYEYQGSRIIKSVSDALTLSTRDEGEIEQAVLEEKRPLVGAKYTIWWEW